MDSSAPGIPYEVERSSTSVLLHWERPATRQKIEHFEVKYQLEGEKKWKTLETDKDGTTQLVTDLKSNSNYVFKVRAVFDDGEEGLCSGQSKQIKTIFSLAQRVKQKAKRLTSSYPHQYKLPAKQQSVNKDAMTRKCVVLPSSGKASSYKPEKTIMVVGATGAGKSTLIDGMFNYALDVAWEDDARFRAIDLTEMERENFGDQAKSQTEWITCYRLNWKEGCQVDFHLNIIDTPGFGDFRGIMRDKQIVDQIRTFFTTAGNQGVDELDAVCFVTQAPLCRLTPTQRYIFDSILALFGTDIKRNIFVLITFADGDEPPVLNTLKNAGVPFEKEFVFNNSALFVNPDKTKNGSMFWKMGKQSFDEFFSALRKTQTRSLRLTSEVLLTRRQLEVDIQNIQRQISDGTQKLCVIRAEERVLEQNRQKIADNKDFTYTVSEVRSVEVQLPPGRHTTTCLPCNRTCHDDCKIPDDDDKRECWAMTDDNCRICPQKCFWKEHKNRPYVIKQETVKVEKTYEEAKKQYLSALKQKDKNITVLDALKMEFNKLLKENELLVHEVSKCINRLQEIALNPTPTSEVEYIDLLIEAERDKKGDDYETRIEMYKELRKQALALEKITKKQFQFPGAEEEEKRSSLKTVTSLQKKQFTKQ